MKTSQFCQLNEYWIIECPETEFIYISYNRFWTKPKYAEHVVVVVAVVKIVQNSFHL